MIRLMLATYSKQEREELSRLLEIAQNSLEKRTCCRASSIPAQSCSDCRFRHLCTDLLAASVFAKDFQTDTPKYPKV